MSGKSTGEKLKESVSLRVKSLYERKDSPQGKKLLAEMRRHAGGSGFRFESYTDDAKYLSKYTICDQENGKSRNYTDAFISTVTLYALHQQGKKMNVNNNSTDFSFPRAVARLCADDGAFKRIQIRMRQIDSASSLHAFTYGIMQMIQLLKQKDIQLNYGELAKDIYRWLYDDGREAVRQEWAKQFFVARYELFEKKQTE